MAKYTTNKGRLYMDALGDPGREIGSKPVYATCVVWTPDEAQLEEIMRQCRLVLRLPAHYEFHARQLTKQEKDSALPARLFRLLSMLGAKLECWCAEEVKHHTKLPIQIRGTELTHELIAQMLMRMPRERVEGVMLIIDERTEYKKAPKVTRELRSSVKDRMKSEGLEYMVGSVVAKPAHQKGGLQIADYLAAALVNGWQDCLNELQSFSVNHWRV